jgi:hypothetical protein
LVIYDCLSEAAETLKKYTIATFSSGRGAVHETVTMPRAGFGPRPVTVLSPESRAAYLALVEALDSALPEASRGQGKWSAYRAFGLEGEHEHVVELDIAACYEYVNHRVLADELLLRSMDLPVVHALEAFLSSVFPRGYGIPQMLTASDRLADAYLSILDRRLGRAGLEAHRFADDIRVLARDWEHANTIVEAASEAARELGLVLSAEKTTIYRRETLVEQTAREDEFYADYFRRAHEDLIEEAFVSAGPYAGEADTDEEEGEEDDQREEFFTLAIAETARRIVGDYIDASGTGVTEEGVDPSLRRFVTRALLILSDDDERVSDEALVRLVFLDARRFQDVCRYLRLRARDERFRNERHWSSIERLSRLGRQSAWAKLWLLEVAERLATPRKVKGERTAFTQFNDWAARQLGDHHEIVRCTAAWYLSGWQLLDADHLSRLYAESSSISRPALAASATRQDGLPTRLVAAMRDDSPLSKAAAAWVAF